MATLTKIGNSQGIRIPKPIIKQAKLENAEIEFEVRKEGLLLKPVRHKPRANWEENIETVIQNEKRTVDEALIDELLNDDDLETWEW